MREIDRGNALRRSLLVPIAAVALAGGCKRPSDTRVSDSAGRAIASSPPAATAPSASAAPAPVPSTAPSAGTAMVDFTDKGARLQYPSTWAPKPDNDFDLHLVATKGAPSSNINFDIPDLPPHLPGMIRLGLIENGYVNDLKKKHAGLQVDSSADHPMSDGCKARLVQCSWRSDGTTYDDVGLLMMRKDHVYILCCNAEAKDLPAVRADFDKMAASLHWDK